MRKGPVPACAPVAQRPPAEASPSCSEHTLTRAVALICREQLLEERDAELDQNDAVVANLRRTLEARQSEITALQQRLAATAAGSADEVRFGMRALVVRT